MRIRNKLITVQLIMTITLFLSILIFSLHMNKYVSINDAEITLGHLDSDIYRFSFFTNTAANKRLSPTDLENELIENFNIHKDKLDFLQRSTLFNTQSLKESSKNIRLSYILISSKSMQDLKRLLDSIKGSNTEKIITEYGVKEALRLSQLSPPKILKDQTDRDEIIDNLNKVYKAELELIDQYTLYQNQWNESKNNFYIRLDALKKRSLGITIFLLIIVILLSFYIGYSITNVITVNLNQVNDSLFKMTNGDFTSSLHIAAGDEFGDLSRNFNNFIEQLWKKLDSMNVIMNDIGHAMNEDLDFSKIQGNILSNVTNHIHTDASAIFSLKNGELLLTASKGHFPPFYPIEEDLSNDRPKAARYLSENNIPLDSIIVNECIEKREPILIRECFKHPDFPQCRNPKSALYISSLMMVPLINSGNIIGIFVVLRTTSKKSFSDLDFSNFSSFSDYAALTIDTLEKYNELIEKFEMQKEIGVAADIQQSLVPTKMPKIQGLTSSAYTLAAKGVSGDYYDFFRMNKYTIGATVCDVAGKGVPASLVMVMIRTILRLVSSPARGAAETLTMLNRSISGKIDVDRYATMAFFKIDLQNMKLNYSNAAHHPIQIFRQSTQKFYAIDSPGLPIGIDRDATFMEKRISLYPGDIIFMYTDGFPEARNHDGDEYSTNRMLREIRLHCNQNANKILDSVVEDMQKFTARASQHDDQTILIIKIDEEK
ncbi:HAMP domain-containing protein [Thiospirochaeta perfilievii]|uniref:HAMP domain-containing protein n=1 Tax=Thiospirochaeta perfilievii TaxID=252967 RepID=A0A5C1Q7A3_9SPIO|nr:SpoIIE family protein phosphatase [Thiospirochaeta perfilievii]QEN03953.1 HAMP domain-containing protein [Thiospirochaeta perfilievii]